MRFGKFNTLISVYGFNTNGRIAKLRDAYAHVKHKNGRCVYSRFCVGSEETIELTAYKRNDINRGAIIKIGDDYFAIASVGETENPMYCKIKCGRCNIVSASKEVYTITKDEYNRATRSQTEAVTFDAVFNEKYISADEEKNTDVVTSVYVLSSPLELSANDIITMGGKDYIVRAAHAGDFRNEYEVTRKDDV